MGMGEDVVLGRGESIPNTLPASSGRGEGEEEGGVLEEFPIYVCVPEDEVRRFSSLGGKTGDRNDKSQLILALVIQRAVGTTTRGWGGEGV